MIRMIFMLGLPAFCDSLGAILFAVLIAAKLPLAVAVGFGVAVASVIVLWQKWRLGTVAALSWISLALILIAGTASVLTNDPRYVMAKPSLVYLVVGLVMLKPGWMIRYMPPLVAAAFPKTMTLFGYLWAALILATGIVNLVIALAWPAYWPLFVAVFPVATKGSLFLFQVLVIRAKAIDRFGCAFPDAEPEKHGNPIPRPEF
ncbi:MAG TPA: septation protein IspZ [Stellaceae bacterium]|nr:septation protein IspZ [Stellaceae bacterium]